MNLYTVKYNLVSQNEMPAILSLEESSLPTHILALNLGNAVETAMKHSTRNYQLFGCAILIENIKLVKEELNGKDS